VTRRRSKVRKTAARVGRPPLGPDKLVPITVRVKPAVVTAIDRARGEQSRSDWSAVTIERALEGGER
jgi:hypothetical protein